MRGLRRGAQHATPPSNLLLGVGLSQTYSDYLNRLKVAVMAFISARQLDDELRRCHFTGQLDGSGIDDLNVGYGERPKAG